VGEFTGLVRTLKVKNRRKGKPLEKSFSQKTRKVESQEIGEGGGWGLGKEDRQGESVNGGERDVEEGDSEKLREHSGEGGDEV